MTVKTYIFIISLALFSLLSACSEEAADDWIELPLADHTYYSTDSEFKQSEFSVLVPKQSWLEFKITMQQGDAIVYSWRTEMAMPERLSVEFHGHTEKKEGEPGTVMFYKKHNDGRENGALIAPFDGIHGWYLNNETDEDIYVELKIAGTFEEVEED